MAAKYKLIYSCLIAVLTIGNYSNADSGKSATSGTSPSQITQQQAIEFKSSLNIGGTYSYGDNVETGPVGSVIVYPLTDNSALFFLDVCRGAPSYNLGQLFGHMTIKNNIGTYDSQIDGDDFNCILKFKFASRQLEVITESGHGDCGFGGNVYADNEYELIDNSIPTYFIIGQGDTILFKDLIVEKYEHGFE